jgi:hypothetical protein
MRVTKDERNRVAAARVRMRELVEVSPAMIGVRAALEDAIVHEPGEAV